MELVNISAIIGVLGIKPTIFLLATGLVGIIGVIILIIKNKTQVGFAIGPVKINLGSASKTTVLTKDCVNSLLEVQEKNIISIVEIEAEFSKRQISYTEQKLSQLKYLLISSYADELAKKLNQNEDVRVHKDYRSYQILCSMLIKELVDKIFKTAFIENHLDEHDSVSWDSYLTDKSNYIVNYISEFMDILYGDGKLLNRKDSAKVEFAQYDAIKKIVKEIFENIREMNRGFKAEITKTRDVFGKKIIDICKKNGIQLENDTKQIDQS